MIWTLFLGAPLLGFSVGMLTGFFGAGGGFIITPALNIFLGLEMNLAVGTSACQVLGASAFSLYHHLDRRLMGVKVAACTGIGIPLGAFCGVRTVEAIKGLAAWKINGTEIDPVNVVLLGIFAVFLLLIGGWMFFDNFYLRRHTDDNEDTHVGLLFSLRIPPIFRFRTIPAGMFSIPVLVFLGLIMGFLGGLLGIGGGVIMLPVLFYLVGQETKFAAQTTTMLIFVSGAFSSLFHAIDHNIDYPMVAVLMCGALLGARCGARLQKKVTGKSLRKYFAFVVLAAWLLVVYKLTQMFFLSPS